MKAKERLYPHQRRYFAIRFLLLQGESQAIAIEEYGDMYGRGSNYRNLKQIASEQQIAQVA